VNTGINALFLLCNSIARQLDPFPPPQSVSSRTCRDSHRGQRTGSGFRYGDAKDRLLARGHSFETQAEIRVVRERNEKGIGGLKRR
jgi:hypothetical protein